MPRDQAIFNQAFIDDGAVAGPGNLDIPEDVIRRLFKAGFKNFHERYSKVVDSWAFFDSYQRLPILIDWSNK
jgi:hypothetical protein